MNTLTALTAASLLAISGSRAQNVVQEPQEDPVQKAIREFNQRDSNKPNEVTVVLDPAGDPPAADPQQDVKTGPPATVDPATEGAAVLVTGKPPEGSELLKESQTTETETETETATPAAAPPGTVMEETPPKPQKGLVVRVEKIQAGNGVIDPAQVKLLAPFPAKPLSAAPAGWRLETSENAPPFTREVELSPGKKITLKIRPHLLVPESDGAGVFTVQEPGFDAALGYRQDITVGAILSNSIRQLEGDSKRMGTAIENLQQLLVSLPKPEPKPAEAATPAPHPKR